MVTKDGYFVYDSASSADAPKPETLPESDVVYRMDRIACEVDGSLESPNAAAASDLAEYTEVAQDANPATEARMPERDRACTARRGASPLFQRFAEQNVHPYHAP